MKSKQVQTNQAGHHPRLAYTLARHLATPYKKPYQEHNLRAFETLTKTLQKSEYPSLILDSCCGTGMSTRTLAKAFPASLVVGIDRSEVRLSKQPVCALANTLFLQANCEDIWRLCVANRIQVDHHFILYPNPYPKAEHLQRRWHAHPVFPYLHKLSKSLTLRSNWRLYLEEFAITWGHLSTSTVHNDTPMQPQADGTLAISTLNSTLAIENPLTLFERKYALSGQPLYQWSTSLGPDLDAILPSIKQAPTSI